MKSMVTKPASASGVSTSSSGDSGVGSGTTVDTDKSSVG